MNTIPECQDNGSIKLDGSWRQEGRNEIQNSLVACDAFLTGWFRFDNGDMLAEHCVERSRCGVRWPGYMSGGHPSVSEGVVSRTMYYNSFYCASDRSLVEVRNCGEFYVYRLSEMPWWSSACNYGACLKNRINQ